MNILRHKSWHVRTKENMARVRKDEAEAKEKERVQLARVALAEQEHRTTRLRDKARERIEGKQAFPSAEATASSSSLPPENYPPAPVPIPDLPDEASKLVNLFGERGHVNLFAELEEQERTFGGNKEHEAEKKAEKEDYEKKIGLLSYLSEKGEKEKDTPWYEKLPTAKRATTGTADFDVQYLSKKTSERIANSQSSKAATLNQSSAKSAAISTISDEKSSSRKRKHKKEKKHHKKHKKSSKKKRRRHNSTSSNDSSDSNRPSETNEKPIISNKSSKSMVQLRAEKMARESEEKLKTERLMRRLKGLPEEETPKPQPGNGKYSQKYNSQFNPELARQNVVTNEQFAKAR